MKKLLIFSMMAILGSCSSPDSKKSEVPGSVVPEEETGEKIATPGGEPPAYDPNRGAGKFTHVDVGDKLNVALAEGGQKLYMTKCSGCHKTTNEKLVGPGWQGVSKKYRPEWIMNFITNTDEMLEKDPKAKQQLEICLVRMPNQSLADNDARQLLEFMRKNDGVK
jgi:cytochrome c551/c552